MSVRGHNKQYCLYFFRYTIKIVNITGIFGSRRRRFLLKILHDVPEILTPSMVMDAELNWHITFPLLDSRDFLMYGKTMILNESSTLNESIAGCLLFAMEMIYAMEMDRYGIKEFWDDRVLRGAMRSAAPIVAGRAWRYDLLSNLAGHYRFHLSNTIWRRKLNINEDGTAVPIEVFPDRETIPAHNIIQLRRCETEVKLSPDTAEKAGYPSFIKKTDESARYHRTFLYYSPLPKIKMENNPDTAEFYAEFYEKCDREIYKWIERLMSALMLRSADAVFAARDMAAVSYLEKWPDESSFPGGDVFMVGNTDPIRKLINILNALPEGALYPNPAIWAASSCERYPAHEAEEQIRKASLETIAAEGTEYEKRVMRSVMEGSIAGMEPQSARITDLINSNPGAIDPDKAKLIKESAAEETSGLLKDAGMDGEWYVDSETGRLVKKEKAENRNVIKPGTPEDSSISENKGPETDPAVDNLLEDAFVDTDILEKEAIIDKAFLDTKEATDITEKKLPYTESKTKTLWTEGMARDAIHQKQTKEIKKETDKVSYIDSILDSAFLDKE